MAKRARYYDTSHCKLTDQAPVPLGYELGFIKSIQGHTGGGQGESLVPLIHAEASLSETISSKLIWDQY